MKRLLLSLLCGAAISASATTTVDVTSSLTNPDFESCSYTSWVTECPGWTWSKNIISESWPKKYDGSWEAFTGGNYYLNLYGATATEGLVASQTITAPETGRYTLTADAYVDAATKSFSLYISNGTTVAKKSLSIEGDVQYSVSVDATKGETITIGIYTETSSSAVWGYADNFKLSYRTDAQPTVTDGIVTIDGHSYKISNGYATLTSDDTDTYLRGADISELSYVESLGAKFYDADGKERDALDIMKENGINTVRLRLYNEPGNSVTYGGNTYALPAGFLDEADVLKLAKRAKEHGMKIELTFHYSDFWTNGGMQFKPKAWENYTLSELKDAIYSYTKSVLNDMKDQGTAPEYVSIGNEIQAGFLFGYYTSTSSLPSVNGYCSNMTNLQTLLNCGSKAVREVCPDSKVIMHLTMSSSVTASTFKWFFSNMPSLDYDMIGASYYPYWTDGNPSTVLGNLVTTLKNANINKDIVIMETGYSWAKYRPYGRYGSQSQGQLALNGKAYNEASRDGQKTFMQELQTVIKTNSSLKGYYYWDPLMVEQKVNGEWIKTGWVKDGENVVGNTTLFDYEGNALPAFDAIREDYIPATITVDGTTYQVLREGETPSGITQVEASSAKATSDGAYYNLSGMRVEHPTQGIYIKDGKKIIVK